MTPHYAGSCGEELKLPRPMPHLSIMVNGARVNISENEGSQVLET